MSRYAKWFAGLLVLIFAMGSFVTRVTTAQDDQRPYRIVVVTHGQDSDPFWSVVKNGVDQAAKDMRVTVEYQAPQTFDMVAVAGLFRAVLNRTMAVDEAEDTLARLCPGAEFANGYIHGRAGHLFIEGDE